MYFPLDMDIFWLSPMADLVFAPTFAGGRVRYRAFASHYYRSQDRFRALGRAYI